MNLSQNEITLCIALAVIPCAILHALTRNDRAANTDEGYLWYGTRELARGQIPIRDFRSYEPGRYLWTLPFLKLRDSVQSVRLATTLILALTSTAVTLVMREASHSWLAILTVCILWPAWGFRPHKRIDQAALLAIVVAAASVGLAASSSAAPLCAGVIVGLVAFFGANHGLYGAIVLTLSLAIKSRQPEVEFWPSFGWLGFGALIGASPLVIMSIFVKGFLKAFVYRRIVQPAQRGSTNLPVPYPLGWNKPSRAIVPGPSSVTDQLALAMFSIVPVAALGAVGIALFGPEQWVADRPFLAALVTVVLISWHHVISRADFAHFALVVPLALAALVAWVDEWLWIALPTVLAVLVLTSALTATSTARFMRWRYPERYIRPTGTVGQGIWFLKSDIPILRALTELEAQSPKDVPWVAIPTLLWVLPLVNRRSAVFDTFCVYPASAEMEAQMVAEIDAAQPAIVMIQIVALDGREELQFDATHPRVWDYVLNCFEPAELTVATPANVHIFVPADVATSRQR